MFDIELNDLEEGPVTILGTPFFSFMHTFLHGLKDHMATT